MKSKKQKLIKLVWACAWCSPSTYVVLKKGEEYTHGICFSHKAKLIATYINGLRIRGTG